MLGAAIVHKEISPLLKIRTTAPAFSNVSIYQRALPQYNLGHSARLAAIEEARENHPNLHLVGNYLRGPAIGSCVACRSRRAPDARGQLGRACDA